MKKYIFDSDERFGKDHKYLCENEDEIPSPPIGVSYIDWKIALILKGDLRGKIENDDIFNSGSVSINTKKHKRNEKHRRGDDEINADDVILAGFVASTILDLDESSNE